MRTLVVNVALFIVLSVFAPELFAQGRVKIETLGGLKVSLIADTQNTTKKLKGDYEFRSRLADRFANVSIRPAAVEALALENMENMGSDLKLDDPDMVLYLGDGANSGCEDEVNDFFNSLSLIREKIKVPVFYVIGNHDYLGTGNQENKNKRKKLCGGYKFYTKKELIELTSKFNGSSFDNYNGAGLLKTYRDNASYWEKGCPTSSRKSEHRSGCFYSAYITFEKNANVAGDLLLVDTSDYRDITARPAIGRKLEGYGIRGAISFNDKSGPSQVSWFQSVISSSGNSTKIRMIASHYPSNDLKWDIGPIDKSGRTGSLMLDTNQNIWFSGHTHTSNPESSIFLTGYYSGGSLAGKRRYAEANVGSTTDYPPHTSTVSYEGGKIYKKDNFLPGHLGSKECTEVYAAIDKFSANHAAYGSKSGEVSLGMTTDYRGLGWDDRQADNAKHNIADFLKAYSTDTTGSADRKLAVSCIMVKSSFLEYRAN